jgi:predicted CopG family antitoxin
LKEIKKVYTGTNKLPDIEEVVKENKIEAKMRELKGLK